MNYLEIPEVQAAIEKGASQLEPKWGVGAEFFRVLCNNGFGFEPGVDVVTERQFLTWWNSSERDPSKIYASADGLDVYFNNPNGERISILDMEYIQALVDPIDMVHKATGSTKAPTKDKIPRLTPRLIHDHLLQPICTAIMLHT